MSVRDAVIDVGAAWRLTRLVTRDALTEGLRDKIERWERGRKPATEVRERYGQQITNMGGPVSYLVHCPYCVSMWVALGVALTRRAAPLQWDRAARVLATSAAVCWLAERE